MLHNYRSHTQKCERVQTFDCSCMYMPVLHHELYSVLLSLHTAWSLFLPVRNVFHVADGIINASLLGAQDDSVEVSIHHRGAETFELRNQPDTGIKRNRWIHTLNIACLLYLLTWKHLKTQNTNCWWRSCTSVFKETIVATVGLTVERPSSSCCAACGAEQGHTAASWGNAASGRSASPGCLHTRCGTGWSPGPIRPPCSSGSCSWNAGGEVNRKVNH